MKINDLYFPRTIDIIVLFPLILLFKFKFLNKKYLLLAMAIIGYNSSFFSRLIEKFYGYDHKSSKLITVQYEKELLSGKIYPKIAKKIIIG